MTEGLAKCIRDPPSHADSRWLFRYRFLQ